MAEEILHDTGDYYHCHWTLEKLVNDFLTNQIRLTGNDDLYTVLKIEIKIDSRNTEMSGLGYLLPNLRQLKLNNSFVPIVRYLWLMKEILAPGIEIWYTCLWLGVMFLISTE